MNEEIERFFQVCPRCAAGCESLAKFKNDFDGIQMMASMSCHVRDENNNRVTIRKLKIECELCYGSGTVPTDVGRLLLDKMDRYLKATGQRP
jgi:hypothetical protein